MLSCKTAGCLITCTAAVLVYLNTLPAGFAFDDNFAVIYNGDVTNNGNSLLGLLRHDFWGQRISSEQSHKSYRPLTVLSFRIIRIIWDMAPTSLTAPFKAWRREFNAGWDPASEKESSYRQLDPLLFHAANILAHGLASLMVCRLVYFLFQKRASLAAGASKASDARSNSNPNPNSKISEAVPKRKVMVVEEDDESEVGKSESNSSKGGSGQAVGSLRQRKKGSLVQGPPADRASHDSAFEGSRGQATQSGSHAEDAMLALAVLVTPDGGGDDSKDAFTQVHLPAWTASLFFALHPIHTEAVAGIVGHAELLCVLLSVPALLLYFHAADSDAVQDTKRGKPGGQNASTANRHLSERAQTVLHWARVCIAVLLTWAAALSKEIGITVVGAMLAYDVMLVPLQAAAAAKGGSGQVPAWQRRKWLRMLLVCVSAVLYVKVRSWVAVDQLVRIYRKVENPIPFSSSLLTRVTTTGHLHALYAQLLLWPVKLSADWSFACVPIVESLEDPRNLRTLFLYAYMAVLALAAEPWRVLMEWRQGGKAPPMTPSQARRRWRLVVLAGLMVGPFFPASNVLFYVGTFIGERLLYFPSIGFCVLLVELLVALPLSGVEGEQSTSLDIMDDAYDDSELPATGDKSAGSPHKARVPFLLQALVYLLVLSFCSTMMGLYAVRTYDRNWDWLSEETLFTAALEVCPNSAKVQLNSGILQRRRSDYSAAIQHFEKAQEVEPTYCEPTYWIGVSLFNQGLLAKGVEYLENSLGCKYVASDAVQALNNIFQALHASKPEDGVAIQRWGQVLVRPEVGRYTDGCESLENAALIYSSSTRNAAAASLCLDACLAALEDAMEGEGNASKPAFKAVVPNQTGLSLSQVKECVSARRSVYIAIGNYGGKARLTRKALYEYLAFLRKHPKCRQGASNDEKGQHNAHTRLVHSIQSQDADDPWLQSEWGEILTLMGRTPEASMHFSVAGTMLNMHAGKQAEAEGSDKREPGMQPTIMSLLSYEQVAGVYESYHEAGKAYERAAAYATDNVCNFFLHAVNSQIKAVDAAETKKQREAALQLAARATLLASKSGQCVSDENIQVLTALSRQLSTYRQQ